MNILINHLEDFLSSENTIDKDGTFHFESDGYVLGFKAQQSIILYLERLQENQNMYLDIRPLVHNH